MRHLRTSLLLGSALLAVRAFSLPSSAADGSAWKVLDDARRSLSAEGPERADFVQTYVPAGFSSGERETGRLALLLPDCLRWDYTDPYPKSFLVCNDQVYSWNAEDRRGQRSRIDRRNQPGLDLLLLPIEELSERYRARAEPAGAGRVRVRLTPLGKVAAATELTGASLVVDTRADRLVEVSYEDQEGNATRFEITNYRELQDRRGTFSPPSGISWEEG